MAARQPRDVNDSLQKYIDMDVIPRANTVATMIPMPTNERLLALGKAYLHLLRAENQDSWDMEQLARYEETWKSRPHWEQIAPAYRAVSIALEAIEEDEEE